MSKFRSFKHYVVFWSQFSLIFHSCFCLQSFFETIQCLDGCLLILQKQLGIVLGISQASFQFYFSIQQLSWGVSAWHISLILFSFLLNEGKKKKVKFPLWAVSMLGCSWPRTFRNFSIKEGGTTCSKWASYLSILRSLSYATMELEVFWSCINPK